MNYLLRNVYQEIEDVDFYLHLIGAKHNKGLSEQLIPTLQLLPVSYHGTLVSLALKSHKHTILLIILATKLVIDKFNNFFFVVAYTGGAF